MKTLTGWAATLAARAGVSAVTLRRWQRTGRMPAWARVLLALLNGELDRIDAAFSGWIIRRGELVSPDGWCFAPGEIAAIPLLYGQVNLWRGQALAACGRAPLPPLRARRAPLALPLQGADLRQDKKRILSSMVLDNVRS